MTHLSISTINLSIGLLVSSLLYPQPVLPNQALTANVHRQRVYLQPIHVQRARFCKQTLLPHLSVQLPLLMTEAKNFQQIPQS